MSDSGRDNSPPGPENPGRRNLGIRVLKAVGAVVGLGVATKVASDAVRSAEGQRIIGTAGEANRRTFDSPNQAGESDYARTLREQEEHERARRAHGGQSSKASPEPMSPEEKEHRDRIKNDPNWVRPTPPVTPTNKGR